MRSFKKIAICTLIAVLPPCYWVTRADCSEYQQVSGLIDLRTKYSDGAYSLQFLVKLAKRRGFHVVIPTDHDRMAMEYGIPPLRHIFKKRVERNSINKRGAEAYLSSIREIEKAYPDMIIIAGSETAPFYYWAGSFFNKNLTAHNHERRILTIGLEKPEDYQDLPILHNSLSTRFIAHFIPAILVFFVPLCIGIVLIRLKGFYAIPGAVLAIISVLFVINVDPFRSSPYDQYHGDQGIAPYQFAIDYVNNRGGMTFWNYPETKSGIRKIGPIFVHTTPYPEVLVESRGYTGFAALYGDEVTVTEPGEIWDTILMEYCKGERKEPVWGISTADFHKEGERGEMLGNFPTIFLVKRRSKAEILNALRKGKMYACRGNYPHFVRLDEFFVRSSDDEVKGISGEEIALEGFPRIRISLSSGTPTENRVRVRLIRSGRVIERFDGELPLEIDYEDRDIEKGEKEYYRMDLHGYGTLVSNPIFVISK
jgi:hypothetical protein